MKESRALVLVLATAFAAAAAAAPAQTPALPNLDAPPARGAADQTSSDGKPVSPRDFGAGNVNILQIPAAAFVPFNTTWTHDNFGYFFPTSTNASAHGWAALTLPSGANIEYVDLWYNDTDASNDASAKIIALGGGGFSTATLTTIGNIATSSGSGGTGYAPSTKFSYTVNNDVEWNGGAQLVVQVYLPSTSLGFKSVDIWWTRQISPAPLTATFADVPTSHPYFRVIEALAASGITSGCGGNNFCPDGIVTRKEIAKFLVRALGLYWEDGQLPIF